MDDYIKSAFELAMEKVAKLEEPSDDQRKEWEGMPVGRKLAANFLKGDGDLAAGLAECKDAIRAYALRGAVEVLIGNLQLPKHEVAETANNRAIVGIKQVFGENPKAKEIVERVVYVAEQYKTHGAEQQQQAFEQLKQQFTAQVQQMMRQQPGAAANQPINVETMPEFQQEWMRTKLRLEQRFESHLDGYRKELELLAQG